MLERTGNKIETPSYLLEEYSQSLDEKFPESIDLMEKQVLGVKGKTFKVLDRGREIMKAIDKARVANEKDPTQNEIARKANTYRYADRKIKEMQSIFSNIEDEIREVANTIDEEVNKPISKSAIKAPFAKEARSHLKSLDAKSDRRGFIRQAIREGDHETVEAILGAPAYLSGLEKEDLSMFLEEYKKQKFSSEIETRDALHHLQKIVGKAYDASFSNVSKLKTRDVERAIARQDSARKAMEA